jgi:hypothetical protein
LLTALHVSVVVIEVQTDHGTTSAAERHTAELG